MTLTVHMTETSWTITDGHYIDHTTRPEPRACLHPVRPVQTDRSTNLPPDNIIINVRYMIFVLYPISMQYINQRQSERHN